ncbi:HEL332Wp [Eremothecium sinecaudum]|uniref:2'-phosphotransferase n=1 Tax=Eremothecium sinecaudum TaxID=45286 RepID=A0A0X8HT40_9SACH|nr:HEL332Wp [Eremothecium sinecaudum]AMD20949.1 HEL332Wp [Eremothecium sinecaudum]
MPTPDDAKRDILVSKAMSYLLRHGAIKEHLPIDSNGYIPIAAMLSHNRLKTHKCTIGDIHRIVEVNDKKRFHIKVDANGQEHICATQGHSIAQVKPAEGVLERITLQHALPQNLIHGTSINNLLLILESKYIKRMGRNHVHMAVGVTGQDSAVISGMRSSSAVHIYLNKTELVLHNAIYKSKNNVYLSSDDISIALIEKVVIRKSKTLNKSTLETVEIKLKELEVPYETS